MRKTTLSEQDIAEMDESKAKQVRGNGLSLMSIRDRGFTTLRNGKKIYWNTSTSYSGRKLVQPGYVILDGVSYDVDELQKWLRWA